MSKDKNRSNSAINSSDIKNKAIRKKEKWSDIISRLNIDISKPVNYVTAKQITDTIIDPPFVSPYVDPMHEAANLLTEWFLKIDSDLRQGQVLKDTLQKKGFTGDIIREFRLGTSQ